MKRFLALTAVLGAMFGTRPAAAAVTFRFLVSVDYSDSGDVGPSGLTEDFWNDPNGLDAAMRGAHVMVYKQGNPSQHVWTGYLGDGIGVGDYGSGYTPTLNPPGGDAGTYELYLDSYGSVNANTLSVRNENGVTVQVVGTKAVAGAGTYDAVLVPAAGGDTDEIFNVYAAESWALHRHAAGVSGQTLITEVGQPTECPNDPAGTCNFTRAGEQWPVVFIGDGDNGTPGRTDEKFVIVHELGHQVGNYGTNNKLRSAAGDTGMTDTFCPYEPGGGSSNHSMRSNEYSGVALSEGFAHFYAADIWNDHDYDDCWFEYYKRVGGDDTPGVDCESATTASFPYHYRRTECDMQSSAGVELDWLRTFWDLHTNGASAPSFTYIVDDFLDGATAWTKQNAYTKLDERADALGGTLDDTWDYAAKCASDGTCLSQSNRICYPVQWHTECP